MRPELSQAAAGDLSQLAVPHHSGAHTRRILGSPATCHPEPRLSVLTTLNGQSGLLNLHPGEDSEVFSVETARSLFHESGLQRKTLFHPLDGTEIEALSLFDELQRRPPGNMNILGLDRYFANNPIYGRFLHELLLLCQPARIARYFGTEAVTWMISHIPEKTPAGKDNNINRYPLLHAYLKKNGVDIAMLHKSVKTIQHWLHPQHPSRAQTLVVNYNLLLAHHGIGLENIDIEALISDPAVQVRKGDPDITERGGIFSPRKTGDYAVRTLLPEGLRDYGDSEGWREQSIPLRGGGYKAFPNRIDALLGFVVDWKNQPQCILSGIASDPETFFIIQVHGVSGYVYDESGDLVRRTRARGLIGVRFETLLERVALSYARFMGLSRLGLLGAGNNPYLGSKLNPCRVFSYSSAQERYDSIAEQSGSDWTYNPEDSNFYRHISSYGRSDVAQRCIPGFDG